MQSNITHHTTTRKSLEIIIPASEVNIEYERIISDVRLKAKIPGFRKGKASKEVLLSRYEKEIKSEIAEILIKKNFIQATQQANLNPICNPILKNMELEENKDGKFDLMFDIAPNVNVTNYKGLSLTKKIRLVDHIDVDEKLEAMRQEAAKFISINSGIAEINQYVTLDIKVKPEGVKSKHYKDQVIQLAADRPFDAEILGMQINEIKNFSLKIPENDTNKFMAGKNIVYTVTVKDIRVREIPELNDDFARNMGEYKNIDDLKSFIYKNLEELYEKDAVRRIQQEALNILVVSNEFEIPESMISLQLDDYCREFANLIKHQGIDPKNINWESYRQSRLEDAKRAIKSGYIIQSIGNNENIQIDNEDLDNEIKEILNEGHITTSFEDFKKKLTDNGNIKEIEGRARTYKVLNHILSFANILKETLEREAFLSMIEAERNQIQKKKPDENNSNINEDQK